ncbi:hypothetical protein FJR11_19380 [Anabaena sp. UHCC 0187]|uniref:hypothetical protein n=1 Tax=Anabaena sp. UHCC 0187 TaxID=2590018 RepID=UPI0014488FFE|nr:hypothetical protein [Anabaena sp. UHCC 0187]MTJ14699.1 hypothetical protein [Anabaena sp. UHCC 0187]
MDLKEYNRKLKDLEQQIQKLEEEYISLSPFKIGDIVKYCPTCEHFLRRDVQPKYYIAKIVPGNSEDSDYRYCLVPPKRDGSMPQKLTNYQKAYIHEIEIIE